VLQYDAYVGHIDFEEEDKKFARDFARTVEADFWASLICRCAVRTTGGKRRSKRLVWGAANSVAIAGNYAWDAVQQVQINRALDETKELAANQKQISSDLSRMDEALVK